MSCSPFQVQPKHEPLLAHGCLPFFRERSRFSTRHKRTGGVYRWISPTRPFGADGKQHHTRPRLCMNAFGFGLFQHTCFCVTTNEDLKTANIKWPCDVQRCAVRMQNSSSSCGEGASARRDSKYLSQGVVDACVNTSTTCSMIHMYCYNKGSCCYLLRLLLEANLLQGATTATDPSPP